MLSSALWDVIWGMSAEATRIHLSEKIKHNVQFDVKRLKVINQFDFFASLISN